MEGGWKTPPPRVCWRAKSPGLIGLRDKAKNRTFFSKLSNLFFDLRPPGKTEERKPDPWGN